MTDENSVETETENTKDTHELKPKRETPTFKFTSVCTKCDSAWSLKVNFRYLTVKDLWAKLRAS